MPVYPVSAEDEEPTIFSAVSLIARMANIMQRMHVANAAIVYPNPVLCFSSTVFLHSLMVVRTESTTIAASKIYAMYAKEKYSSASVFKAEGITDANVKSPK